MNIEDCEVEMEVKCKDDWDDLNIKKDEKYKIKKIVDNEYINFGGDMNFNPNYFEPANKKC